MNKYRRVYFRITTSLYRNSKGIGFNNDQDRQKFHIETLNLFLNDGWKTKKEIHYNSGRCQRVIKDNQELYLHPDSFSGVLMEDNIPYIEQLISNNSMFKFYHTDIYDEVFDITDEDYLSILQSKKKQIENDILEVCKTKRSNLYITSSMSVVEKVLDKHRIKRLSDYIGVHSSSDIDWKFVTDIFKELVETKRIITATTKSGTGYRTDKKLLPKITA